MKKDRHSSFRELSETEEQQIDGGCSYGGWSTGSGFNIYIYNIYNIYASASASASASSSTSVSGGGSGYVSGGGGGGGYISGGGGGSSTVSGGGSGSSTVTNTANHPGNYDLFYTGNVQCNPTALQSYKNSMGFYINA
jgi:hypothetical protein